MIGIIFLSCSWLNEWLMMARSLAQSSLGTKKMPLVYNWSECLNILNFLNCLWLRQSSFISFGSHNIKNGLLPMLVKYADWSGFYLSMSLINLWLSPYCSTHFFCNPFNPVNGVMNILSPGSICFSFLAIKCNLMKN